jgi:hypothetical protein
MVRLEQTDSVAGETANIYESNLVVDDKDLRSMCSNSTALRQRIRAKYSAISENGI